MQLKLFLKGLDNGICLVLKTTHYNPKKGKLESIHISNFKERLELDTVDSLKRYLEDNQIKFILTYSVPYFIVPFINKDGSIQVPMLDVFNLQYLLDTRFYRDIKNCNDIPISKQSNTRKSVFYRVANSIDDRLDCLERWWKYAL